MSADTLRALWLRTRAALGTLPPDDAKRDARLMIQEALRLTPAQFLACQSDPLSAPKGALDHLEWMVARRAAHMPISHIFGVVPFWGRDFEVTADTLAPRGDTETLIEAALSQPFTRIADLGTGTGCIAITLLAERPQATGLATDISAPALEVAGRNAARHGVAGRLSLRETSWAEGLEGRVDLLVSNPPYIDAATFDTLAPEVRLYEPRIALTPGGDGLDAYRAIARALPALLVPGGRVLLEIGHDQGASVQAILQAAGLKGLGVLSDLSGKDRVVFGDWAVPSLAL